MATTTYDTTKTTATRSESNNRKTAAWIIGALVVLALILFYAMGDRNQASTESNAYQQGAVTQPATGTGTATDANGTATMENRDANTANDNAVAPKTPDTTDTN